MEQDVEVAASATLKKGPSVNVKPLVIGTLAACAVVSCSANDPSPQVLQGQAKLSTFPASVDEVRAVQGGKVITSSSLGSDGKFSLSLPAGPGYSLVFASAGDVGLVFPRSAGGLDSQFDVRTAAAPFDLGTVRYIGDPAIQNYSFQTTSGSSGDGDGECEDGVDANGAFCVDDDDDDEGATCEEADENDGGDESIDCVDGIDSATGLECDGGPSANADDGEEDDDGAALPSIAAVADHNLPSSIGCEEEDGEEDDDNEAN